MGIGFGTGVFGGASGSSVGWFGLGFGFGFGFVGGTGTGEFGSRVVGLGVVGVPGGIVGVVVGAGVVSGACGVPGSGVAVGSGY